MHKLKIIFWGILITAIGIIVYQNEAFFIAKQIIKLKIFSLNYHTPSISTGLLFIIWALLVFFITYIHHFLFRIKTNRVIKKLKTRIKTVNSESSGKNNDSDILDS